MPGATPKLTKSDNESRSFPNGENEVNILADAPSMKSNKAAAAMVMIHHQAPDSGPIVSLRWKAMNIATHPDKRLRQVMEFGVSDLTRLSIV